MVVNDSEGVFVLVIGFGGSLLGLRVRAWGILSELGFVELVDFGIKIRQKSTNPLILPIQI